MSMSTLSGSHNASVDVSGGIGKKKKDSNFEGRYDVVFGPKATTGQVYEKLAYGIVESVLSGFNGTMFACV